MSVSRVARAIITECSVGLWSGLRVCRRRHCIANYYPPLPLSINHGLCVDVSNHVRTQTTRCHQTAMVQMEDPQITMEEKMDGR